MQRSNTTESQDEELTRLRKLVNEQESTISSLQQEMINHRQSEMNARHSALASRNDVQRLERTKNNMTRYGRRY
jgi:hypothetical protein